MSIVAAGTVTSVDSKSVGSPVVGFAGSGAESLFVNDNADFSPGDQVLITPLEGDAELYVVGAVDDEAGITLTSPLMEDASEGTWVAVYPLQYETVATVRLVESGEVRDCIVLHTLADALRPGIRDEATSESVLTVRVGAVRYVFDVVARQTVRDISDALPGVAPAQPDVPELTTLAYLDSMTGLRAQITAAWSPVTLNEDGSDITDLDRYEVQTLGADGGWQTYTSTPGDIVQAFIRDLEPGSEWSVRVRAVDTSKNASEWSDAATITAATDNLPPSQPSQPILTSRFGVITITWDGESSTAGPMDDDLAYVEIHLSSSTGFTPDVSTKVDQIPRAASVVWGPADFDETYYVKLVAVDTSGNASTPSVQEDVVVAALVDVSNFPDDAMEVLYARTAHFITLDADQITSNSAAIGFLETGTIVGGIFEARDGGEFRTNADPDSEGGIRIRDADGFMAWADGGGTPTVEIDRTTGLMTARGGNFINVDVSGSLTASGGSVTAVLSGSASPAGSSAALSFTGSGFLHSLYSGSSVFTMYSNNAVTITAPSISILGSVSQSGTSFLGACEMNGNALNEVGSLNNGGSDILMDATIKPDECYLTTTPVSTGGEAVYMGAGGRLFAHAEPSLMAYKDAVREIAVDLDALALVTPITWRYKADVPFEVDDPAATFHGIPADPLVGNPGLRFLTETNANGVVSVQRDRLSLALLAGFGNHHSRIGDLEQRFAAFTSGDDPR